MSYTFKNAAGSTVYAESDGAGTSGDPYVPLISSPNRSVELFNNGGTNDAADGALRDTSSVTFALTGYGTKKNRTIFLKNGLDQSVTVEIYARDTSLSGTTQMKICEATIVAGGTRLFGYEAIGDGGAPSILITCPMLKSTKLGANPYITISCSVAPSSGAVSAAMYYEE